MQPVSRNVVLFNRVRYAIADYQSATEAIITNAISHNSFGVSALAVHGLMESYNNSELCQLVNSIDLVVPDGQPVKWALNSFFNASLKDRVYGPTLVLHVFEKANAHKLKIFLYGSKADTLEKLSAFINTNYPDITICGTHADRFREATPEEDEYDINRINSSGAHIVLVGRGCPRQEKWVSTHLGKVNAVMMAVGAAFDFHAGTVKQAPAWMQSKGLEWLFRLVQEPNRLWKRYLFTNSQFILLFCKYKLKSSFYSPT